MSLEPVVDAPTHRGMGVGNNTGTRASDCGKSRRACANSAAGVYQDSADEPSEWL